VKSAFGRLNKENMKVSPSGFPGLLLIVLAAVGAYLLFGRQSFLIVMAILLAGGTITAVLIRRFYRNPEKKTLALTHSDESTQQKKVSLDNEAAEQVTAADTSSGPR
jgi:membrane protein implicated in regulation of membrane protease activity